MFHTVDSDINVGPVNRHTFKADQFRKYSLIYAYNGAGKTTISRMLRAIETGYLPDGFPSFEKIRLLGDNDFKISFCPEKRASVISVFNCDFVAENIAFHEGRANPIFYLSDDQVEAGKRLKSLEAEISKLDQDIEKKAAELSASEKKFREFKTTAARSVRENLKLLEPYDARHLTQDVDNGLGNDTAPSSEQLSIDRALVDQAVPLEHHNGLTTHDFDHGLVERIFSAAETGISGAVNLDSIIPDRFQMWVREGYVLHDKYDQDTCQFCTQPLPPKRLHDLSDAFDEAFDKFERDLVESRQRIEEQLRNLDTLSQALPNAKAISATVRSPFSETRANAIDNISQLKSDIRRLDEALEIKIHALSSKFCPLVAGGPDCIERNFQELKKQLNDLNSYIARHNNEQSEFSKTIDEAKYRLRSAEVSKIKGPYREIEENVRSASKSHENLVDMRQRAHREAERLKSVTRDHHLPLDRINHNLASLLGRSDTEIRADDNGYRIFKDGAPDHRYPSEGEQTAIAFSLFLARLFEHGATPSEKIIVIDDPISSLDANALFSCSQIIQAELFDARQIIILTHNTYFMNEIKKSLKGRYNKDQKKAKDAGQKVNQAISKRVSFCTLKPEHKEGRRWSVVTAMEPFFLNNDSEYIYLYSLVKSFASDEAVEVGSHSLMPNVIRRMLETFSQAKLPGAGGLQELFSRYESLGTEIEPVRLAALKRLINVESHGDDLSLVEAFSQAPADAVRRAASDAVAFMRLIDPDHLAALDGAIAT